MRKVGILMLALCVAALAAACGNAPAANTGSASSGVSGTAVSDVSAASTAGIAEDEKTQWETFLKEMEGQAIPYDDVHTLENSGMRRPEIMKMSAADIRNEMEKIRAIIRQNKIDLARELLADWDSAKNDSQFVCTDKQGTTSLTLIEDCIASIKANDWGSFFGLMIGGTVPAAYEVAYIPDGDVTLTVYRGPDEITASEYIVTDICESELFYQFSDQKGLYFSIPKQSLSAVKVIEDYQRGSDLPGAEISAKQACETAADRCALIYGYLGYTGENKLGNPINGYGIVIPESFSAREPVDPAITVVAEGAATILDKLYYIISFYKGEEFAGESYYVDAGNMENILLVSMVDGSLIPTAHRNAAHFSAPKKDYSSRP